VFCRNNPVILIDSSGLGSEKPEVIEAALRKERAALEALGKQEAKLLIQKGQQEVNISTRTTDVDLAKHDLEAAQSKQLREGSKKALVEGTGTRKEIKNLELANRRLQEAQDALKKTNEGLTALKKQIATSKTVIEKLVKQGRKIGANIHAAPDDPKVTAKDLADVDEDVLSEKIKAKEAGSVAGKTTGGGGTVKKFVKKAGSTGVAVVKNVGKATVKSLPVIGIGAGLASAADNFRNRNYVSGTLDLVGLIPVAGDAVDLARVFGELAYEAAVELKDTPGSALAPMPGALVFRGGYRGLLRYPGQK
jgi:hypothetical protein